MIAKAPTFPVSLLALGFTLGVFTVGCGEQAGGPMQVFDIQPRTADIAGDQPVDILGANFRTDIGYTVYFGNQRAQSVAILDSGTLRVRTPNVEEAQAVPVTVLADDGPAYAIRDAFSFVLETQGAGGANQERGNLRY